MVVCEFVRKNHVLTSVNTVCITVFLISSIGNKSNGGDHIRYGGNGTQVQAKRMRGIQTERVSPILARLARARLLVSFCTYASTTLGGTRIMAATTNVWVQCGVKVPRASTQSTKAFGVGMIGCEF